MYTIFTDLPPAQVTSLMTDSCNLQQIRKCEIMPWRYPRAAAPIVAPLLLGIAFAAVVALWGR